MFENGGKSESGGNGGGQSSATVVCEQQRVALWAEGRLGQVMGVVNAAIAEAVSVISEVLEAEAWDGMRSPEHWVAWRCGVSFSRARALVAMARRSSELPVATAAFSDGLLSEDSMRLIADHVPADRDEEMTELGQLLTVAHLRRILRALPLIDRRPAHNKPPVPEDDVRFASRDDGRWSIRGELSAERGALVQKALERSRDAEFRTRHPEAPEDANPRGVSWADALERTARAALDALDPATAAGRPPSERYQVVIHIREEDLGDDSGGLSSHLHLGPALTAAARRLVGCDTTLRWVLERESRPLSWGQRQRTIPPALRALIEDRDGGCRRPDCTQVQGLEIHHIVHIEDGGLTVPENLIATCGRDHRLHHEGKLGISGDPTKPDGLIFTDEWGRRITAPPPTPPGRPPTQAAADAGITYRDYVPPTGERLDPSDWFNWN